jgi:hypothetical protein
MLDADSGTARTTIVGGQPRVGTQQVQIPIGIERILYVAARDDQFKMRLIDDVHSAVASLAIKLTPSEMAILENTPRNVLENMIRRFDPSKHSRRRFGRAVAAAALSVATGTVAVSCDATPMGITVDRDAGPDASLVDATLPDSQLPDSQLPDTTVEQDVPIMPDAGGGRPDVDGGN